MASVKFTSALVSLALLVTLLNASMRIITPSSLAEEVHDSITPTQQPQIFFEYLQFASFAWDRQVMSGVKYVSIENCEEFSGFDHTLISNRNKFLLVKSNNCNEYTLAHYAQIAGAKMLILVDNTRSIYTGVRWHPTSIPDSDSIEIAVIMIPQNTGNKLIEYIQIEEASPIIQMIFDRPVTNKAMVELWLTPAQQTSHELVPEVANALEAMKDYVVFVPHYLTYHADEYARTLDEYDCLENGIYCMLDPDQDGPLNGRAILKEAIRERCVLEKYGEDSWWKYQSAFTERCVDRQLNSLQFETCSSSTMADLSFDWTEISKCFDESFQDGVSQNKNNYLEGDRRRNVGNRIRNAPSLVINDFIKEDNLNEEAIMDEICNHLENPPAMCSNVKSFVLYQKSSIIGRFSWVFVSLGIFAGAFFLVYKFVIQKKIQSEMEDQVVNAVNMYLKFTEKAQKAGGVKGGNVKQPLAHTMIEVGNS